MCWLERAHNLPYLIANLSLYGLHLTPFLVDLALLLFVWVFDGNSVLLLFEVKYLLLKEVYFSLFLLLFSLQFLQSLLFKASFVALLKYKNVLQLFPHFPL